jgi:hypothetical protein
MRIRIDYEMSPRAKRLLKFGLPALVLLLGGVALANVPHTLNTGDTLSAQAMNDNFTSLDSRLSTLEGLLGGDGGTASGRAVWKDGTGALVPVVRYTGGNGGGNAPWPAIYEVVDPASKAVWIYVPNGTPTIVGNNFVTEGFVGSNCTGTAYVFDPPPGRYAFQIGTDPSSYYVVQDNAAGTQLAGLSYQTGGGCQNSAVGGVGVPITSLTKVTKPTNPPGTPPYHLEIE